MSIAYIDCCAGISGEMLIKAFVNAGMPRLQMKRRLPKGVADCSHAIFDRLLRAEARVRGVRKDRVTFPGKGGEEMFKTIVGAAIGFHFFGFETISSSPLPVFRGRVVEAVTLELLKGIPLEPSRGRDIVVTPTGAAIITTMVKHFGESPLQKIERIGFGDGLRLMIGEGYPVVVIEATVDDMNPQIFDHVIEQLFRAGAVDVTLQPCQAKKNRPAVIISCQSPWEKKDVLCNLLLKETTTFGVRYFPVERKILERRMEFVTVKRGKVRVKVGMDKDGRVLKWVPEYEDVKRLARKMRRPLAQVYADVMAKLSK